MTLAITVDCAGLHRVTRVTTGRLLAVFTTEAEASSYIKERTMKRKIIAVTTEQLDKILLPLTTAGRLRTRYNTATTATEYRAGRRIVAVSVGSHHFAAA